MLVSMNEVLKPAQKGKGGYVQPNVDKIVEAVIVE